MRLVRCARNDRHYVNVIAMSGSDEAISLVLRYGAIASLTLAMTGERRSE